MKIKLFVTSIFFLLIPFFGFAQVGGTTPGGGGTTPGGGGTTPSPTSNAVTTVDIDIPNPISVGTIPEFMQKVLELMITIGIPILAMAIIYAGLLFVTAHGKASQIENAKNALLFAVIGGFILLASWLIAEAVKDALTDLITMI